MKLSFFVMSYLLINIFTFNAYSSNHSITDNSLNESKIYLSKSEYNHVLNRKIVLNMKKKEFLEDFKKYRTDLSTIFDLRKTGILLHSIFQDHLINGKLPEQKDLTLLHSYLYKRLIIRLKLHKIINKYYAFLIERNPIEEIQVSGVLFLVNSILILLDDYQEMRRIIELEDKVYTSLNIKRPDYGKNIEHLRSEIIEYRDKDFSFFKIHAIRYYKRIQTKIILKYYLKSYIRNLNSLIIESTSYETYLKETQSETFSKIYNFFTFEFLIKKNTFINFDKKTFDKVTFYFSKVLGDLIGDIKWRNGKLYNNKLLYNETKNLLRPLDILMDKTPFKLTDAMIPGHWGHDAIWIGSKEQLITLGIWDHPVVKKFHQNIQRGHSIVEALRPKVMMSPLGKFLNVDDLAIVRNSHLTKKETIDGIIETLLKVGLEYDFNFNLKTKNEFFCSELIYDIFNQTDWQTRNTLGRSTISPDDIATITLKEDQYKILLFYTDGEKVDQSHYQKKMKKLIYGDLQNIDSIIEDTSKNSFVF